MRVTRNLPLAALACLAVACQSAISVPSPIHSSLPTPGWTPNPTLTPTQTPAPTLSLPPAATPSPPPAATPSPSATSSFGLAPTGPTQEATVVRVVDGDTIHVVINGQDFALRYIGIDTPETVHPSKPVEWMGSEASAANRDLVDGRAVVLEEDVSETDRYGRLLRYVWLNDDGAWLMVNFELVRLGFAQVSTYPPDVRYVAVFLAAQREARESGLGLWGDPPVPSGSPIAGDGCDPAYPTVCIAPPPPDLDCADISFRRFTVLPPDPHQFDGDHNGIGCELGVR